MVDINTFNNLDPEERKEFWSRTKRFIQAVLKHSGCADGWDFYQTYEVKENNGTYYISRKDEDTPFAGITSRNKKVIQALMTDACQNFGR